MAKYRKERTNCFLWVLFSSLVDHERYFCPCVDHERYCCPCDCCCCTELSVHTVDSNPPLARSDSRRHKQKRHTSRIVDNLKYLNQHIDSIMSTLAHGSVFGVLSRLSCRWGKPFEECVICAKFHNNYWSRARFYINNFLRYCSLITCTHTGLHRI